MSPQEGGGAFGVSALKAIAALGGVFVVVRFGMPHIFRLIASGRTTDGFPAAVLLIVLGAAWVMEQVHLSMALGAFLTGLLLSDSEFRHQIEAIVEPFRNFLLSLFFVAIGMSVDFGLLINDGLMVFGHVAGLMSIKAIVLFGLALAFGHTKQNALRVALLLPQAGEFGFVLFGVALTAGVMDESLFQTMLLFIAVTMAVTPLLGPITAWATKFLEGAPATVSGSDIQPEDLNKHIVLAGFGRVGETVATMLQRSEIPYVALDLNQKTVTEGRAKGYHVFFGDASNSDVLKAASAGHATMAVVTLDDPHAAEKAVAAIRFLHPGLPIQARARDQAHSKTLYKAGATTTVPITMEASLQLGKKALLETGIPIDRVEEQMQRIREDSAQTSE